VLLVDISISEKKNETLKGIGFEKTGIQENNWWRWLFHMLQSSLRGCRGL